MKQIQIILLSSFCLLIGSFVVQDIQAQCGSGCWNRSGNCNLSNCTKNVTSQNCVWRNQSYYDFSCIGSNPRNCTYRRDGPYTCTYADPCDREQYIVGSVAILPVVHLLLQSHLQSINLHV
jgi:hypothetical protein